MLFHNDEVLYDDISNCMQTHKGKENFGKEVKFYLVNAEERRERNKGTPEAYISSSPKPNFDTFCSHINKSTCFKYGNEQTKPQTKTNTCQ